MFKRDRRKSQTPQRLVTTVLKRVHTQYLRRFGSFYALFTGIMFSGLCLRSTVRSFVRPFVPLQVKVIGRGIFDEVEVQSTWNLVHVLPMTWSFWLLCQIRDFTPFSRSIEHRKCYCVCGICVLWTHSWYFFNFNLPWLRLYASLTVKQMPTFICGFRGGRPPLLALFFFFFL